MYQYLLRIQLITNNKVINIPLIICIEYLVLLKNKNIKFIIGIYIKILGSFISFLEFNSLSKVLASFFCFISS
ncbi:hypothetical protein HOG21_03805 [bacterium]|nr:hypothetical protein [bacterium]